MGNGRRNGGRGHKAKHIETIRILAQGMTARASSSKTTGTGRRRGGSAWLGK